ncbi:MAG: hypothetical protein GY729_00540 [Desulfobacteraceae bacterium]|nr:hypothetical protein [Desulfobacteraceae bacterium]
MKRFKFKLDAVLNYREYLERIAQQKTAKAHMDITNCQQGIEQLKTTFSQSRDILDDTVEEGIKASALKSHYTYLGAIKGDMHSEINRRTQLQDVLKEKLVELKRRSIDKKAMELLKEKRKSEYDDEYRKAEQKNQDEISSLKTARESNHETL